MPTTEPTTTPTWLEELVPPERRQAGRDLIADFEAVRGTLDSFLDRFVSYYIQHDAAITAAIADVAEQCGEDYELVNGLSQLVAALDGVTELYSLMANTGVDPDQAIRDRSDFFDRPRQAVEV